MVDFSISHKLTDDVIISNDLALVLQQIDLLFDTMPNTVLGDDNYGTNYDRYLYNFNMTEFDLEKHILQDIQSYVDLKHFNVSVSVTIVEGTVRDIALIDITLSGDYESYNTIYTIK